MARRHKRRIFSGHVCEQIVYSVAAGAELKTSRPKKPRFANKAERAEFNRKNSERKFAGSLTAIFEGRVMAFESAVPGHGERDLLPWNGPHFPHAKTKSPLFFAVDSAHM